MQQTFDVSIPVTITLADVLDNIGFGRACQYWGNVQYAGQGNFLVEPHDEPGREIEVSIKDLRAAFALAVRNNDDHGNTIIGDSELHGYFVSAVTDRAPDGIIEWGDIDDYAADAWMQIAAWGHLVYG